MLEDLKWRHVPESRGDWESWETTLPGNRTVRITRIYKDTTMPPYGGWTDEWIEGYHVQSFADREILPISLSLDEVKAVALVLARLE